MAEKPRQAKAIYMDLAEHFYWDSVAQLDPSNSWVDCSQKSSQGVLQERKKMIEKCSDILRNPGDN